MTAIDVAALVVTYGSTAVCWAFVVAYQLLTRGGWRRSSLGVHLMAIAFVDATIFTMLTAAHLWPWLALQPWFRWTYVVVVAGIAGVTAWRLVILWRANHPRAAR